MANQLPRLALFALMPAFVFSATLGLDPASTQVVGKPGKTYIHLTPEMLSEIRDQLIIHDIAEVDIDAEAFDIPSDKGRKWKKNALDEIEFISERDPLIP